LGEKKSYEGKIATFHISSHVPSTKFRLIDRFNSLVSKIVASVPACWANVQFLWICWKTVTYFPHSCLGFDR